MSDNRQWTVFVCDVHARVDALSNPSPRDTLIVEAVYRLPRRRLHVRP